jgi:hypothetical protein
VNHQRSYLQVRSSTWMSLSRCCLAWLPQNRQNFQFCQNSLALNTRTRSVSQRNAENASPRWIQRHGESEWPPGCAVPPNPGGAILPTFPDLERSLVEKYGGLDKVIRLHSAFYDTCQAKDEPIETFLQKKKLMAARILPAMTEKELVDTCRTLLRDELVMYSAFASPHTLEELSTGAGTIESLLAQKKAVPPATTSTRSLSRCHYCPGIHFHADCPELQRNPGNDQGAATAAGRSRRTVGPVENQQQQ